MPLTPEVQDLHDRKVGRVNLDRAKSNHDVNEVRRQLLAAFEGEATAHRHWLSLTDKTAPPTTYYPALIDLLRTWAAAPATPQSLIACTFHLAVQAKALVEFIFSCDAWEHTDPSGVQFDFWLGREKAHGVVDAYLKSVTRGMPCVRIEDLHSQGLTAEQILNTLRADGFRITRQQVDAEISRCNDNVHRRPLRLEPLPPTIELAGFYVPPHTPPDEFAYDPWRKTLVNVVDCLEDAINDPGLELVGDQRIIGGAVNHRLNQFMDNTDFRRLRY